MAKISTLPLAGPLDGTEGVPLVQGGQTRQINPADHLAYIALGAQAARDQAADLVLPQNIFVDVALGDAEAAVADGTIFKLIDSATGIAAVRKRTVAGSDLLYEEVTKAALGAAAGGLNIGFKRPGLGMAPRNIMAKLLETLSSDDMVGIDPTGVNDSTLALQNLFAEMEVTGRVTIASGTYKVTGPLTIPRGVIEGGAITLDFREADPVDFPGTANGTCVTVQGSAMTKIANLAGDLNIGDRIIPFAAPHGLVEGQSFNLSGTVDYAGNGYRAYYRKGEMFRVAYVIGDPETSTSVAIEGACRDTYAAADTEVWMRSGDGFTQGCASLTILGPDTIGQVIRFVDLDRSNIGRIRVEGGKWSAISIQNCFDMFGDNLRARQNAAGTSNYGIVIANSQGAILNGEAYGYFNGITVGGSLTDGGKVGMNRDIHFEGRASSHPTAGLAGANVHGNCENCSYRGVFGNGLVLAGNKNEAHGEFIGRAGRPAIVFGEMHGHEFTVTGIVRTVGADLPTNNGAIHQSGYGENSAAPGNPSTARYGGRTKLDLRLHVPNATRFLLWRSTDLARSDAVLDLRLDLMEAHPTTRIIVVSKNVSGNDFPLIELNRFNIFDPGPAITWSINNGTAFKNMRDEQTISIVGSGASSYTQAVTFPITFPRTPIISPSLASQIVGGAARQVVGLSGSSSPTGCTVQIGSVDGTNQNANATISVVAVSR